MITFSPYSSLFFTNSSSEHYFGSFTTPLLEEAREELRSSLEILSHDTPLAELKPAEPIQQTKQLVYRITVHNGTYKPAKGDVFLLTGSKPRHLSDITTYVIGYVLRVIDDDDDEEGEEEDHERVEYIIKLSSSELEIGSGKQLLFISFLMNLTTSTRIWISLAGDGVKRIINKVVSYDYSSVEKASSSAAAVCLKKRFFFARVSDSLERFKLNDSQKRAIADCLSMRQKYPIDDTIKLIWGPPGTGKTKTTSTLLLRLLEQNCRTLICAPTNTAVVEVASRFHKLFKDEKSMGKFNFSIGDVILFGNSARMKVDDDLSEIFLTLLCHLQNCSRALVARPAQIHD